MSEIINNYNDINIVKSCEELLNYTSNINDSCIQEIKGTAESRIRVFNKTELIVSDITTAEEKLARLHFVNGIVRYVFKNYQEQAKEHLMKGKLVKTSPPILCKSCDDLPSFKYSLDFNEEECDYYFDNLLEIDGTQDVVCYGRISKDSSKMCKSCIEKVTKYNDIYAFVYNHNCNIMESLHNIRRELISQVKKTDFIKKIPIEHTHYLILLHREKKETIYCNESYNLCVNVIENNKIIVAKLFLKDGKNKELINKYINYDTSKQ